jgi:cell division transport system permease protein
MQNISDIYFKADDSHRFLPWLIGIITALATLLLCASITLGGWISHTGSRYGQSFTVNLPAGDHATPETIEKIEAALEKHPAVRDVARIDEAQLRDMLKPWLGNNSAADDLPLPVVLDVTLKAGTTNTAINYEAMQKDLSAIAPEIEIDAHERWVAAFSDFSAAAQWVIMLLSASLATAMVMMIAFTSRASLKLHSKTVQLLHSIGAEDRYVARQFQNEAMRLTLYGALGGSAAAAAVYLLAGLYLSSLPSAAMPVLAITLAHVQLLLFIPLGCAAVAWLVARRSVLNLLQQTL